ncbi:phosphoenolpyruvate mutase [Nanoarchaeota archaeon]
MTLRHLITPEERRRKLSELLKSNKLIKGMEVHNALSGLIVNDLKCCTQDKCDKSEEFDFFWESSLTDSASKGHPDIEIISFDSRLRTISEILEVTNKPMIVDGDTGGDIHHFEYLIPKLEKTGVSAIIIEDKIFPKRNSLEGGTNQDQEDPDKFANKIMTGKKIQRSKDFMIIARIESLIAGKSVEDALYRARKYLLAGVDGIMIHSKSISPKGIFEFAEGYKKLCHELNLKKPLVCVPTTYNSIYEEEFKEKGFNVVIYANHMLRSSYKAMQNVGRIILENKRSLEADPYIVTTKEVFEKVGFLDIKEKDKSISPKPTVIIPAAGAHQPFESTGDIPKALIQINGKTLLEHQISAFKAQGLDDINVIIGYQKEKFNLKGINYFQKENYSSEGMLHSIMEAKDKMKNGFIYVNSDILLDEILVKEILGRKEDIVIVVDNSYLYHEHEVDKKLDCVITKNNNKLAYQRFRTHNDEALKIGRNISTEEMTHEYLGLAKFSKVGAENLIKVYEDCKKNSQGRFHDSINFKEAVDTDMIQEMINRGFKIAIHETHGGWLEIHNEKDLYSVKDILSAN